MKKIISLDKKITDISNLSFDLANFPFIVECHDGELFDNDVNHASEYVLLEVVRPYEQEAKFFMHILTEALASSLVRPVWAESLGICPEAPFQYIAIPKFVNIYNGGDTLQSLNVSVDEHLNIHIESTSYTASKQYNPVSFDDFKAQTISEMLDLKRKLRSRLRDTMMQYANVVCRDENDNETTYLCDLYRLRNGDVPYIDGDKSHLPVIRVEVEKDSHFDHFIDYFTVYSIEMGEDYIDFHGSYHDGLYGECLIEPDSIIKDYDVIGDSLLDVISAIISETEAASA